ncbi:hypothetical protein BH09DEP1_BH09DEP1_6490 [soil metagenome]
MKARNVFCLAFLSITPPLLAMDDIKSAPILGAFKFSPDSKHLVVFEKENVAVYETIGASKKGVLENLARCYQSSHQNLFGFSPRGTYLTYHENLWTLADLKEHLPKALISRVIKAWNEQETVFVSYPLWRSQPNALHVHDAVTGQVKHQIDFSRYGNPLEYSLSNDGSLLAFIYFPTRNQIYNQCHCHRCYQMQEREKAVIFHLQDKEHKESTIINNGDQVVFSPDNDHALIMLHDNSVYIVNNKPRSHTTYKMFECAMNYSSQSTIATNGLHSIITNKCNPHENFIITQNGDSFTMQRHTTPENSDAICTGITRTLSVFQAKNDPHEELIAHSLYLRRMYTTKRKIKCLLRKKYALAFQGIQFAGSHDQLLLVPCPLYKTLFLFSLPSAKRIGKLPFKELALSPDTNSFIIATEDGQKTLFALPSCIDILARQSNNSYFSLLPPALRDYLRNFKAAETNAKAPDDSN